jgi:hypothetical protein
MNNSKEHGSMPIVSCKRQITLPVDQCKQVGVNAPSNTLSDEPVGGNIVLDGDIKTFNLEAHFLTGKHKRGGMLEVRFQDIDCPTEKPPR